MASETETKVSDGDFLVAIHPLAIMNIADHYTRAKLAAKAAGGAPRVIGMLFGRQEGRKVEIFSSFECSHDIGEDGKVQLRNFKRNAQLYTAVFESHEVLGWYSTGSAISAEDLHIHRQVKEFNEKPFYLVVEKDIHPDQKHLPVNMYATETHMVDGAASEIFVKYPVTIATFEMERLTIDHVSSLRPSDEDESSLVRHFGSERTAMKTLQERIQVVLNFLKLTKAGAIPMDHALLREVSSICQRLPALDTPQFTTEFLREHNDTLLMTLLASATKGAYSISEVVDKAQIALDRRLRRPGYPM